VHCTPRHGYIGELYGLEKFWAFLRYRKDKRRININPQMQEILKNFTSVEDFRQKKTNNNNNNNTNDEFPALPTSGSLPSSSPISSAQPAWGRAVAQQAPQEELAQQQ
jgi:la-related protein 1